MGLQFRKRTKGKNSWLNISSSKKNGLSASLSVKLDKNLTLNFGGKGNRRATINFGNGIRYVKYRTPKAKTKAEPKVRASRSPQQSYTYTPVEPRKSRDEVLEMCQGSLIEQVQKHKLSNNADLQEILDLYNAIDIMRNDPDSLENRDLMIVTTNQYIELTKRLKNDEMVDLAETIKSLIVRQLPEKPKPVVEKKEEPINKTLLWGTVIGICVLIAMCSA